jgi:hypothetical protein
MRTHNHNDPITHLAMPERLIPVLIDSGPKEAEGFVPSIAWSDKPMSSVRRLLPTLVEGLPSLRRQKEIEKEFGTVASAEWDRIREMLALKDRLNAGDWSPIITPNLNDALTPMATLLDRVSPGGWFIEENEHGERTYRSAAGDVRASISFNIEIENPSWSTSATELSGRGATPRMQPGAVQTEEMPEWSTTINGAVQSAAFAFSAAFTAGMSKTKFVVWWHDASKRFVPGLYCPDIVTALYALAMWSSGTAGGWAICQKCHKDFARKRAKQLYCKPQCQSAAGMKRLRDRRERVAESAAKMTGKSAKTSRKKPT